MTAKTERIEVRLSARERERIDWAATLEGKSLSSFVLMAAAERAEQVIAERTMTVVPSEYFDRLLKETDEVDHASRPAQAAARVRRRRHIW